MRSRINRRRYQICINLRIVMLFSRSHRRRLVTVSYVSRKEFHEFEETYALKTSGFIFDNRTTLA